MRRMVMIAKLSVVVLILLSGLPWGRVLAASAEIDAAGLKGMMESDKVVVVFPLSSIEFNDMHIPGSVNIPMESLAGGLPADKETKIAFYCLGRK